MTNARIVLADDHQLMREGLRSLLAAHEAFNVVGEAGDGETVVRMSAELQPDVIIMDIGLPGADGIAATEKIIAAQPDIKIIALSMHANKLFVQDMFQAGASGYLLKECAAEELFRAIDTVLAGQVYLSPKVAGIIVESYAGGTRVRNQTAPLLAERECEVLRLLAAGKTSKEIALHLNRSIQTIDACRRTIMDKLGMDSLAQLVKYAIREGLSTLDP